MEIELGDPGKSVTLGAMIPGKTTSILIRVLGVFVLLPVLAFCGFGLLATYEPMPAATQWLWRAIYGAIAAAALFGIARLALGIGRILSSQQ